MKNLHFYFICIVTVFLLFGCNSQPPIEEIGKQFIKPVEQLPSGAVPGTWLEVKVENDDIVEMKVDENTSSSKKEETEDLMAKLRSKSKGSKFKQK